MPTGRAKSGQSDKHLRRFGEGGDGYVLRGMEVFTQGTHRGKKYSAADLADMEQNFRDFSAGAAPVLRVPAVLGHEETQEYLERSDLPAAGWAESAWRDGRHFKLDMADVPRPVARLLEGKAYRTVSAEIYDYPPEGVPGGRGEILAVLKRRGRDPDADLAEARRWAGEELPKREEAWKAGKTQRQPDLDSLVDERLRMHLGKMLRRVAFLGGEIPQIKSLADIPAPRRHSEDKRFRPSPVLLRPHTAALTREGAWACFSEVFHPFSEVSPMNREELIQRLASVGFDTSLLTDEIPDEVLAEMVRVHDAEEEEEGDEDNKTSPDGKTPEERGEGGDGGEEEEEEPGTPAEGDFEEDPMKGQGNDVPGAEQLAEDGEPVDKDAARMRERAGRFMARARKFCNKYGCEGEPPPAVKNSEGKTMNFAEVEKVVRRAVKAALERETKPALEQLQKFSEEELANRKRAAVESFVEDRCKAGKILPAEKEAVTRRLLRADARSVVEKFTEKGKAAVPLTELDLQMREIDQRPAFRFGERVRGGAAHPDDEMGQVEVFYEKHEADFTRAGVSKEEFVKTYKAAPASERRALLGRAS